MKYGVNLSEIHIIELNGKNGWGTSGEDAKQIIPAEGKPGILEISFNDLTIELKQNDLLHGIPVKLGSVCYLILTLLKQKSPESLFKYDDKDNYRFEVLDYDFRNKIWKSKIVKLLNAH